MLGMGWPEMAVIGVIALLLFGPDRLPGLARQAGGFVRAARHLAEQAKEQVGREIGHDLSDYSLGDLDPRAVVRRAVLDDESAVAPPRP